MPAPEKRTDSDAEGRKSTPGTDGADLSRKDPNRGPQGGLHAQGEGAPLKSDEEQSGTADGVKKPMPGEGEWSGRDSQRGSKQAGIDQQGRQGTANQMNDEGSTNGKFTERR